MKTKQHTYISPGKYIIYDPCHVIAEGDEWKRFYGDLQPGSDCWRKMVSISKNGTPFEMFVLNIGSDGSYCSKADRPALVEIIVDLR